MAYNHGVRVQENKTSLTTPRNGTAGLQVIIGVAPVNLAEDPYDATNKPKMAYSFAEASAAVGYCDDFENYNICESIDASFRVLNIAPIVLINVLDPRTHRKVLTEQTVVVTEGQAVVNTFGILADTLVVKTGDRTMTADTDYLITFDDEGMAVITLVDATGITELTVSGYVIDPTLITYQDIIGGYNVSTGEEKGMEVIRHVFPKLQLTPGLLVCPGWSKQPNVGAAIAAKCTGINGVFSCEAVVDLDTTEDSGARKYTDVLAVKQASGFVSEHLDVEWPCVRIGEKIYHASAIKAALIAYTDAGNDDVPSLSPSNKAVGISGLCLEDGTEVILDEQQANVVNSYGVCTFNNFSGWTTWGNNTAIYPASSDPKDRWLCCRRFFSWWGNSFILTYHERVDDSNNPRLIEAIVDDENVKGNSYVAQGKCAGAYIEWREDENTVNDIMAGKMRFLHHLAPWTPAEDILDVLEFDPELLEAAFTGGEA
ncbi:hypothetical protein BRYFOR_07544 [Marvinbryantia formatexigens DSM 14469]|uniref:Phage tail sheath protein n=1 Tax=Marvinbryantia formatexigens DSM 14469 TaxID=478749 RepID=C6LFY4_9FIRM|nr:hypothetical protein [Marvinbryantia formatexigens]EET60348.1 hypothetical protein BRYFOR_07544 [Marvinbryantia formatexigens DSM 14469]UWO25312.1 phage tail sheath family protein [Marvinbryantia formatexigens DSM 14469]SDG98791.1 hypothetical protein SAMN05660368_03636 [Marvinbryantia formatexigens]